MAKNKSPRHPWYFKVHGNSERKIVWTKVVNARAPVTLALTEENVLKALAQHGQGNTQLCAGTVCLTEHEALFPHPTVGYTDWQVKVVFVASKKKGGWPSECVRYTHHDNIAKLFNTASGCRQLIERIRALGGTMVIRLLPYKSYKQTQPNRPNRQKNWCA